MNYYDVFNLSPTASFKEINEKHKVLAKQYHPDINDSDDAHEKMAKLNEAYEVLSDVNKREVYDRKLRHSRLHANVTKVHFNRRSGTGGRNTSQTSISREDMASQLRKRAEERLKEKEIKRQQTEEFFRQRAERQAKKAAKESAEYAALFAAKSKKQEKIDEDKQHVIDVLSMLSRQDNARLKRNLETDEERHHAIKVLLSLVKDDDKHLRKIAEETERQQRIKEILTLVNANNKRKEK